ncbi:hypothetical protein CASFOL_002892 [Castilleja foliolosa]|uniref:Uncharacterized protein n=1 Tax=Castilleja foliolosa TaxID=1961234 RepID=A0ABD3EFX8_9LAMI
MAHSILRSFLRIPSFTKPVIRFPLRYYYYNNINSRVFQASDLLKKQIEVGYQLETVCHSPQITVPSLLKILSMVGITY